MQLIPIIRVNMIQAFAEVQTGQVTFAARDSDYDGHNIKQGEILGLENGKLAFTEKDITKAVYKLIKSLVKRDSSFVTMIYGADVSDAQAEKAYEAISAKLGDSVEINLINGGQPGLLLYCFGRIKQISYADVSCGKGNVCRVQLL